MMNPEFQILNETKIEFCERRSRFIGAVFFISRDTDVKNVVSRIKKEHPGANHVCYAFQTGRGATKNHGMSDDGEPKGTAGRPILEVLKGSHVTDCLIAVIRYFGGTKLGTGGLVRAYTRAAQEVLAEVECEEIVSRETIEIDVSYDQYQKVRELFDNAGGVEPVESFGVSVLIQGKVPIDNIKNLIEQLTDLTMGKARIVTGKQ